MRRRRINVSLCSLVLATAAGVRAQADSSGARRIGYLGNLPPNSAESRAVVDAFRLEMRRLGWIEGSTVIYEFRFADGANERFAQLARDLTASRVDLIAAMTTNAAIAAKAATSTIPIVFIAGEPESPDELPLAIRSASHADAWLVDEYPMFNAHRARIIELIALQRKPAIYSSRAWVREGGLMAYSDDAVDMWRRAAGHVDRVLRGTKPADIPVEEPTRYILSINQKTARTLGITIDKATILRADEVLE